MVPKNDDKYDEYDMMEKQPLIYINSRQQNIKKTLLSFDTKDIIIILLTLIAVISTLYFVFY